MPDQRRGTHQVTCSRSGFEAADTSEVKTRLLSVIALLAALMVPFLASPAHAAGNDYPYRNSTSSTASDRWGFTQRQCVSFTAWRLAQHHRTINNSGNAWGNASHWDEAARAKRITISSRPRVGAVAQWNAGEKSAYYAQGGGTGYLQAGPYGHVAYVTAVYRDGSVTVEQYNVNGNRSYSTMHVRANRYLYV
jgi:surface antigen